MSLLECLILPSGEDHTPTVLSISPLNGPLAGHTLITVMGRSFTAVSKVVLGKEVQINLEVVNRFVQVTNFPLQ